MSKRNSEFDIGSREMPAVEGGGKDAAAQRKESASPRNRKIKKFPRVVPVLQTRKAG